MGWTIVPAYEVGGRDLASLKEYFRRSWESDPRFELVDMGKSGNTLYSAIRIKETGEVFAVVTLVSFKNGEFSYKEIHENCGPLKTECPQRILNKLTPTENQYALNWRKACRNRSRN